eukprot:365276-Chlamydomonas_euryale.AAC.15
MHGMLRIATYPVPAMRTHGTPRVVAHGLPGKATHGTPRVAAAHMHTPPAVRVATVAPAR